jgi:plastocyanin
MQKTFQFHIPAERLLLWGLVTAAVMGVLAGILIPTLVTQAQDMESHTVMVQAGAAGLGAAEALIFAPANVEVHRGDTVIWSINGFHNIRFTEESLVPFVLIPGVHDVEIGQVNPVAGLPTVENGASYSGGELNSGLPAGAVGGMPDAGGTFSLVMDLEPGTYSYLCDVHPGMVGEITVVGDDAAIPSALDVAITAKQQIDEAFAPGNEFAQAEIEAAAGGINTAGDDGVAHVQAGTGDMGRLTVNRFFAFTTVINAGQTVTWTLPDTSADPHTVTWPPLRGQDVIPQPQDAGPPILAFGPGFTPNVPENGEIGMGAEFNSALMLPGQSFSLTFTEPGVYPFVCNIHPGMEGTVVVVPEGM